jgi:hypothetical protein
MTNRQFANDLNGRGVRCVGQRVTTWRPHG